jgi:hypothetical protein
MQCTVRAQPSAYESLRKEVGTIASIDSTAGTSINHQMREQLPMHACMHLIIYTVSESFILKGLVGIILPYAFSPSRASMNLDRKSLL